MVTVEHYQPFYCEENAWWLCRALAASPSAGEVFALFISNPSQTCLLAHQRAGGRGGLVVWDYHVVVLTHRQGTGWQIWDPDTTLTSPLAAHHYLRETFAAARSRPSWLARFVGSSRVDLQACKLEYSIVSPK